MTESVEARANSLFAFTAFRRGRLSYAFTGVHVAGFMPALTVSAVALLIFVNALPHVGDPLWGIKVFGRASAICLPALLFSFWAQVTAARAALVGDEKLTARARSRQVAISMAIILGCIALMASRLLRQDDELNSWLRAFLFTTLFGVYALTLLKDQVEDSVLVGRLWRDSLKSQTLLVGVPVGKWAESTCIGRADDLDVVTAYAAAWACPIRAVKDGLRRRSRMTKKPAGNEEA